MKKLLGSLVLAVCCVSAWAVDLAVPEELVGNQTIGIVHVHLKAFKFDQIGKTLTDKLGEAPDPKAIAEVKDFVDKFKAAGGQGVSIIINADKNANAANASDGIVFLVTKGEDADNEKLAALFNGPMAAAKDKMAPGCPKEIGSSLVWHSAKYKLAKKGNEERAQAFSEAYSHLSKDASVSVVIVPDEDAVALAEASLKDAKPEEAAMMKALLGATGFCLFTDFGVAAEPALKVLVLAADADGAVVLDKSAKGLIGILKKEAPPPLQSVLKSLQTVQAGSNVQLSIDIGDLVKAIKAMAEAFAAPPEK